MAVTGRIAKDKNFQYLRDDIAEFDLHRNVHVISLNEAACRKERDKRDTRAKLRAQSNAPAGSGKHKNSSNEGAVLTIEKAQQESDLESGERNLNDEMATEKRCEVPRMCACPTPRIFSAMKLRVLKSRSLLVNFYNSRN